MLRRLSLFGLVLAAGLAGCDAGADAPDEERILGTRTATSVNTRAIGLSVPVIDLTDTEPESSVTFGAGNSFRLSLALPDSLNVADGEVVVALPDAVTITGTYALDTAADRVTVTRTDVAGTLTLRYAFRGTNDLELIAEDDETFGALIGVAVGEQYQALARVIDGGSIRFES